MDTVKPFLDRQELCGTGPRVSSNIWSSISQVRAATPVKESDKLDGHVGIAPMRIFSKWQNRSWVGASGEVSCVGKEGRGEIELSMPAGPQGAEINAKRVNHFDWHSFYEKLSGGGAFYRYSSPSAVRCV